MSTAAVQSTAGDAAADLPADVAALIGQVQYEDVSEFPVERGYIWTSCASVENGNPLFWDESVAAEVADGWVAPPSMLSVWTRPHSWAPGRTGVALPLQVHFDLKARLSLPEAIIVGYTMAAHEPVRPGDRIRNHQILRSVGPLKPTKLGTGRFWVVEVHHFNQRDELVGVETYDCLGYRRS